MKVNKNVLKSTFETVKTICPNARAGSRKASVTKTREVLFVIAFSAFHSIRSHIFHPLHTGAAFSTLAVWCRVFQSRVFHPCIFDGAAISVLAFSVAPKFHTKRDLPDVCLEASRHTANISSKDKF